MTISVIIPNYNGENLLKKNLPAVLNALKNYENRVEIIIADDLSTDNSLTVITEFMKKINLKSISVKTIENKNKDEKGFSKNVNRGVHAATGEILILLNTDVSPREDFLKPLLSHFDDPEVFAVGCLDESHENGKIITRGRGLGKLQRGFLMHHAGSVDKSDTLWVSGGSGAFRKSSWEHLQGLDTLYNPFYWEDIDLSYRALKSGYKILFEPKSVVTHEHEEGAIKKKYTQKYIKKIAYRNQFIFVWKNITDHVFLMSHIIWLPYHFIKALANRDMQFYAGFFAAFLNFGKIMKARKEARRAFIKSDRDIFKYYANK